MHSAVFSDSSPCRLQLSASIILTQLNTKCGFKITTTYKINSCIHLHHLISGSLSFGKFSLDHSSDENPTKTKSQSPNYDLTHHAAMTGDYPKEFCFHGSYTVMGHHCQMYLHGDQLPPTVKFSDISRLLRHSYPYCVTYIKHILSSVLSVHYTAS